MKRAILADYKEQIEIAKKTPMMFLQTMIQNPYNGIGIYLRKIEALKEISPEEIVDSGLMDEKVIYR